MEKFRVGQIGLGGRGMGHLSGIFCERDDVVVTYVCDVYEDRCAAAVKMVEERRGNTPKSTTNYKEVCESPDVDVVIVTSAWENHIPAPWNAASRRRPRSAARTPSTIAGSS